MLPSTPTPPPPLHPPNTSPLTHASGLLLRHVSRNSVELLAPAEGLHFAPRLFFLKRRGLRQKRCRLLMVALHENTRRGGEGVAWTRRGAQRVCDTDNRHPRRTAHGTQAPTSSKSPAKNSRLTNHLFSNNQNKIFFIPPPPFFILFYKPKVFTRCVYLAKGSENLRDHQDAAERARWWRDV